MPSLCTATPLLKLIGNLSDFFEERGGCTQANFARSWQKKPFIKMILGVESTTDMSRNDLSAFSTSVVLLVKIIPLRLCLARLLKSNDDKKPSEEHLSKSPA